MRVLKLLLVFLTAASTLVAQTPLTPAGSGTAEDPYLIGSLGNLFWITQNNERLDDHYRQINDIDADSTATWFPDGSGNYAGFLPIGTENNRFQGTYDGSGHIISNLYIGRDSTDNVALFGYVSNGYIHDLELVNADIRGRVMVAGMVGRTSALKIERCVVDGDIIGRDYTGGVVAALYNNSKMSQCVSYGKVRVNRYHAGGTAGFCQSSDMLNCYNFAAVSGGTVVGGLTSYVGPNSYVAHSYSTGRVSGGYFVGGLIGDRDGGVTYYCFWDKQTSGQTTSRGGYMKTTEEMTTLETYTNAEWDFDSTWSINPVRNNGYPYLQWQTLPLIEILKIDNILKSSAEAKFFLDSNYVDQTSQIGICWNTLGNPGLEDQHSENYSINSNGVYTITLTDLEESSTYYVKAFMIDTAGVHYTRELEFVTQMFDQTGTKEDPYRISELRHLEWIANNPSSWDKYFIQTNDINAGETQNWNNGSGWGPIGNHNNQFQGKYNGQHFAIDSLFIDREEEDEVGLFGCIGDNATLKYMRLTNFWVKGHDFVGGLAGRAFQSNIYNSYVDGFLEANRISGLLVGDNQANIYDSESHGYIQASYSLGGLTGTNGATISRCENFATVKGWNGATGGLVGSNTGKIYYSINRSHVEGNRASGGLVGDNRGLLSNSYNRGDVISPDYAGGVVGEDYGATTNYCYNTGYVYTPGTFIGGVISYTFRDPYLRSYFKSCFWDTVTSTVSVSAAGTGKSTGEMKDELTFMEAGWNFNTIWAIDWSVNDGYPHLFWEANTPKVKIIRVDDIGADSAVVLCELFYLGDPYPDHYGLCWGQSEYPTMRDQICDLGASDSTHKFYVVMKDLEENSRYYIRTFVDNFDGASYGDTLSFTTLKVSLNDPVPEEFKLAQNYPNPFNPTTSIKYQLAFESNVELVVFDMAGRKIETLVDEVQSAGYHAVNWDARTFASGIYICQLKAGQFVDTKKMVFMK